MDYQNVSSLFQNISNINNEIITRINTSDVLRNIINLPMIQQLLKILTAIFGSLIFLWIIIKFISFILNKKVKKRIFLTYENTEDIKKKLDEIDKKLNIIIKERKREKKKKKKKV